MRPLSPNRVCSLLAAVAAFVMSGAALGQARVIEDIRITADDDQAVIVLEFACEMRFVADTPIAGGALLEVRVAPFDSCRQQGIGTSVTTESYLPVGADRAHLVEVEFDSLGLGESIVSLTFDRPVDYRLRQRSTLRQVEISVDLLAEPERRPISVRTVDPAVVPDYMINLQSTTEAPEPAVLDALSVSADQYLYVSQIRVDGVLWHRLRLGFFGSEGDARQARDALRDTFPRAWIGRAEPAEIQLAATSPVPTANGPVLTLTTDQLASDGPSTVDFEPVSAGDIDGLMADARDALIDGIDQRAVMLYSRLAATPGQHRAEAIEFLGLAYERSGQPGLARREYQRHIREFPNHLSRLRVEQRLNAVIAMQESPPDALREGSDPGASDWEWSAGFSQYYRRDENRFDQDQLMVTTQSVLMTDADFSMSRAGEDLDLLARISLNNYHDLLDPAEGGRGDQNRVSYAWLDLAQSSQKWDLRVGRQSLHTFGVLGRFDGAHFSYGIGEGKRLHATTGFPVESTRDAIETDRDFAGVAVEFTDLVGTWDFSAFLNTQTIEGFDARMAVGTEVRYFDDRRNLTAMLDYDVDFGELNLILVLGTWRLANRMTLSALIDQRKSPLLSTRNALIGQPVETIEELLLVWTEEEVRQLALDRTTESSTITLGLATPLGERLQLNFDVTTSELDGNLSSGGVPAIPPTGVQNWYSTSLVATGLFGAGDVNIWSLRTGSADSYETSVLTWDGRFPVGRRLRINPRIRLVQWNSLADGRERSGISPSLRFLFNKRNRYRLEFEVGRDETTRSVAGGERESSSRFVSLGYRASF